MNIKQALKRKNVLVNEIKQEFGKIQAYNSLEVGSKRPYSAKDALKTYMEKTNELITLKTAIHKANAPVYGKIFRISELKSMVRYLGTLNCNEGKQRSGYGMAELSVMSVEIDVVERDNLVKKLETEIDQIQDELDYFNSVTEL